MKTKSFLIIIFGSLFLGPLSYAETPPSWYDVKAHVKQLQKSRKASGKLDLENFSSKKIDVGTHKVTMTVARFGSGNSEAGGGFNVTEVYAEPPTPGKVLFHVTDKTGCDSKVAEDIAAKKLGFIQDTQVYFLQVYLVAPSCPKSEISSPKVFVVVQEKKNSVEKVYESSISESGKYRIDFKKEIIHLEYAKSLNSSEISVDLNWDDGKQKFVEGSH